MKQAVIQTGGQQYIVQKDQELMVDLVGSKKQITFQPLLVFDEESADVGTPQVGDAKVTAKVVDHDVAGPKIIATRYKPKKRVHKRKGHRQHYSRIKITGITKNNQTASSNKKTSENKKQQAGNPASKQAKQASSA